MIRVPSSAGAAVRMLREWTRSWRLSVLGFPAWLASHARTPVRRGRSREDRGVLRRSISNPRQGAPPDRRNGADGSARKKRRNAFPPNESTGNYEMSPQFLFVLCGCPWRLWRYLIMTVVFVGLATLTPDSLERQGCPPLRTFRIRSR